MRQGFQLITIDLMEKQNDEAVSVGEVFPSLEALLADYYFEQCAERDEFADEDPEYWEDLTPEQWEADTQSELSQLREQGEYCDGDWMKRVNEVLIYEQPEDVEIARAVRCVRGCAYWIGKILADREASINAMAMPAG